MRADVGDGPQFAAFRRIHPPVEIGRMEEPVLRVAAGGMVDVAQFARANAFSCLDAERVVANVVADPGGAARRGGDPHQLRSLTGVHRQRLFAEHMPARPQNGGRLLEMKPVGCREVDDIHRRVGEHLVERCVALRQAQTFGRGLRLLRCRTDDAGDVHAGPTQPLDVHRPDESGAHDGGGQLRCWHSKSLPDAACGVCLR